MNVDLVDPKIAKEISEITGESVHQEEITPQLIFLATLLILLLGVIFADNVVQPGEEERLQKIFKRFVNQDDSLRQLGERMIEEIKSRHLYTQPNIIENLAAYFSKSEQLLLITLGYEMSAADGTIHPKEKSYLEKIAKNRLNKLSSDCERYLPVLEASFTGKGQVLRLPLEEVKKYLQPSNFTKLGDAFVKTAANILIPMIDRLDGGERWIELPYNKSQRELQELLKSRYPLIFIRSSEEIRVIECILSAHKPIDNNTKIFRWSKYAGFLQLSIDDKLEGTKWIKLESTSDQKSVIIERNFKDNIYFLQKQLEEQINTNQSNLQYTYILPDWTTFISPNSFSEARLLKELIISIEKRLIKPKMTLIIVGQDWSIPVNLRNFVHVLDLPLPTKEEFYQTLFKEFTVEEEITEEQAKRLSEQAQGMTLQAATQVTKLISTRNLWTKPEEAKKLLLEVKKQEIRKTGVLEYYEPQGQGLQDVGGLETLKDWLKHRGRLFLENTQPKLRPRAILLEGYPGCGKSFIAKAIAQEWGIPQINFEISRLRSKYVGESESNTHEALRAIESSAPNILFMDEIEKAFSGVEGDSTGVSTRQFGTFLSWLNDHNYPIFFIATSNDRSKLPPELFRAGRFDEIFIIMPPNQQERPDIIQKKAAEYQLPPISETDLNSIVERTAGFSGAELEKLVKETAYLSYGSSPTLHHWLQALSQTKPQFLTPRMQTLLINYKQLLDNGGGKLASSEEADFFKKLIQTNPMRK